MDSVGGDLIAPLLVEIEQPPFPRAVGGEARKELPNAGNEEHVGAIAAGRQLVDERTDWNDENQRELQRRAKVGDSIESDEEERNNRVELKFDTQRPRVQEEVQAGRLKTKEIPSG